MKIKLLQLGVGMSVIVAASYSHAQQLPLHDPTRPPQVSSARIGMGRTPLPSGRIQMLLIGESRKYAVIDGILLRLGDLHHQWRLSSINADSVVMKSASGTQVIKANPSVVKTIRPQVGAAHPTDSIRSNEKNPTRRIP